MGCVTAQSYLVLHKRLNMINKHCKPRWLEFYRWFLLIYELEQLNYDLQYKAAIKFNVIIVTNTCTDFTRTKIGDTVVLPGEEYLHKH